MELYLYRTYYSNHPYISKVYEDNKNIFSNFKTVLDLSLSLKDNDFPFGSSSLEDLIKQEALQICNNFKWVGLMACFALSSAVAQCITIHYSDSGLDNYKLLFNRKITPRIQNNSLPDLHMLFLLHGVTIKS